MIDLHCHILPGIDDGAGNLADSVAMARQAEADGIELICATPHIRSDHDVRIAELEERTNALNAELVRLGVRVRVVAGGEVAVSAAEGLDDRELGRVALGGRWILLEPLPGPLDATLLHAVEALWARGYRSLIAHPERHPGELLRTVLTDVVAAGALVQATAALLAEGPASEALLALARDGLVHVLGSDSHSAHIGRPVRLSAGLARMGTLEELRPHLEWVARLAPEAILRGEDPVPPILPPAPG